MRIVQIVPSIEPRHGGPSVSVPALATGLARLGHDVSLLSTGAPSDRVAGVEHLSVSVFPREWPQAFCPSAGLRKYLHQLPADVLHSHGLWLRTLHYAHRQARREGLRHVISPRGMMAPWAWNHHRWRKEFCARFVHPGALAAAHGWHATSQAEADEIRARGFTQPVCVAPNGVAAPSSVELERAEAYWRQACPEAFQQPTALFYSRLHPKKRVLELIDLWLDRAPRDWLLLVVGIPETYTVTQLNDYVHRSIGRDRIRVFDGTSVPPPYVAATLFLLPSHSENFGLVVAEALAHGLTAIVTDTTPWRTLDEAGHGWCVPWGKFPEVLDAALSEAPAALRQRGNGARAWVLAEYSWEKCASQLADFYARLKHT
jgi:glycosyltransferase involved in cell wall biosynthesis